MSEQVITVFKLLGRKKRVEGMMWLIQPMMEVGDDLRQESVRESIHKRVAEKTPALPSQLDEVESGLYRRTYRQKGTS